MTVFEIIEANVHQWQERPTSRMPRVMTSVNTEKMREQLVSLFKAQLALIPDIEEGYEAGKWYHAHHYSEDKIREEAKQEVAREIFKEIEKNNIGWLDREKIAGKIAESHGYLYPCGIEEEDDSFRYWADQIKALFLVGESNAFSGAIQHINQVKSRYLGNKGEEK